MAFDFRLRSGPFEGPATVKASGYAGGSLHGTDPVRSTVFGAHPTPAQPPSRRIMTAAGRRKIAEARKETVGGAAETERQGYVGRPLLA